LQSPSESVLVSAASQHVEFKNDVSEESSEEIPAMKKRGYFTDQFEVKFSNLFPVLFLDLFARTKATLTRTTVEPGPKYGARQVGISMPLSQAQVRLSLSILVNVFESHALIPKLGTGGTVAGVGRYLKSMNEDVYVAIADPEGSGLFNKVTLT
jgi:cysteine synthase A